MGAAYRFSKAEPARYEPTMPAVQQKDGIYTQHESFACVSQTMTSTNNPCFVGTPSMDGTMVALEFSRAKMDFSDMQSQETRLYEGAALLRLYLSADQFATLLRDRRSESPCGLSRLEGTYLDNPPRMISSVSLVAQAKRDAMVIGEPLITAAKELQQYLDLGEKVSTKADYAALRVKVEAVCEAMLAIRPPMQALLKGFAGDVAEAAVKQLIADIQEPLKALGMTPAQMLGHII